MEEEIEELKSVITDAEYRIDSLESDVYNLKEKLKKLEIYIDQVTS